MNYSKIHDALIERARCRIYDSKIHHNHHIIPIHEDKNSTEVVPLTIKEHALVHLLRFKIWGGVGNLKAYLFLRGLPEDMWIINSEAGKIGGKKTKENASGIFSPNWDRSTETTRRWNEGVINNTMFPTEKMRLGGYASVASGKGIFSPDYDRSLANSKIWDNMSEDTYLRRVESKQSSSKTRRREI